MNGFWEVFPVIVIFPTFGLMLKWYLEYRTKKHLIDKGLVDEKIKFLQFGSAEKQYVPSSLKWGLVSLFVGAGLMIVKMLPYRYTSDELTFGVMLMSAGAALILYYVIASVVMKNEKRKEAANQ
jgi:hypothetical protein